MISPIFFYGASFSASSSPVVISDYYEFPGLMCLHSKPTEICKQILESVFSQNFQARAHVWINQSPSQRVMALYSVLGKSIPPETHRLKVEEEEAPWRETVGGYKESGWVLVAETTCSRYQYYVQLFVTENQEEEGFKNIEIYLAASLASSKKNR